MNWILMIYILTPLKYLNGVPLAATPYHVIHSSRAACEDNHKRNLEASKKAGNSIAAYCAKQ